MQVLSELDIVVPLQLLIGMFSDGVNSLKELANQRKARASDLTGNTGARRVRETLYMIQVVTVQGITIQTRQQAKIITLLNQTKILHYWLKSVLCTVQFLQECAQEGKRREKY